MTIRDLYEYAQQENFLDYDIEIQYRDGGGFYSGTSTLYSSDIELNRTDKIVTF